MKLYLALLLTIASFLNAKVAFVGKGFTYDDVLLVPQKSTVQSRKDANLQTSLSRNIRLNIPLISANMDTVTEAPMAIQMALLGGIGIIHRFNSIEEQVQEVLKVKRYHNKIITHPITISHNASLIDADRMMKQYGIHGLLVTDEQQKLVGILTNRDIHSHPQEMLLVKDFMTPRDQLIVGEANIDIMEAYTILTTHRLEKLPLVHEDGTIAGLITYKDIHINMRYPLAAVNDKGQLLVGAAIGVKDDALERARALVQAGVDVLVIDIAHGHSDLAISTIKAVKDLFPHIDVIAGNVVTAEATRELILAGADAIKIGVGPGSICTTRIVSGSGFPQLSALLDCAEEADTFGIPIIADGGIRYPGDITKAIAAGASTVMLGSLFAGTEESPGMPFIKNGKKYKIVRGMASFGAHLGRTNSSSKSESSEYVAEGVEAIVPYKGSVTECVKQLLGGLSSGMSYCGATNIDQLRGNGVFVEITASGKKESHPHDIQEVVN